MGKIMNSVSIWGFSFAPFLSKKILLNDIFLIKSIFFEK